jgi:hypothetical protein
MHMLVTLLLQVQALAQFGSLPAGVDLIVMRQEKLSAAKIAATAAKVSAAAFHAPATAAAPLPPLASAFAAACISGASAAAAQVQAASVTHMRLPFSLSASCAAQLELRNVHV